MKNDRDFVSDKRFLTDEYRISFGIWLYSVW